MGQGIEAIKRASLLEQAAEIFLAGNVSCAFLAGEAGQGLVFHFEPFQPHDADVFLAMFPNLALAQFHAGTIHIGWIEHNCRRFQTSLLSARARAK